MRNKRFIIAITGAVICGLLGVLLVTRYLSQIEAHTRDLNNVVVARQEIPLGAKITAEQLGLAPIPNGSAPEGAFRKVSDVVGRVAITPIGLRETITTMKLAAEGTGGGLPAVIPEGYRAMTVKVDEVVGVSGFVMPGSYVDVVAVIVPQGQQNGEAQGPISKIVLQHIKVLAIGAKIDSPADQREPANVKGVTLQVTPQEAEKLVLASNEGKLQLVMRNYRDSETAETQGANKNSLLRGEDVKPEPPPPSEAKAEQAKTVKPVKRVAVDYKPREEKPVVQARPRNSIELIEGAKRRDVQMP
jgi:pilus assembly protein CpaB